MTATQSLTTLATIPSAVTAMTRREFLYYVWAASMALFMAETGIAFLWFAYPWFKAGQFGGRFTIPLEKIPAPKTPDPVPFADGRFWLVNVGEKIAKDLRTPTAYQTGLGLIAFYQVCVHLGCLYKWIPANNRYECPCHGSKYLPNGIRIDGPARRNLDRFVLRAMDAGGKVLAETKSGDVNQDSLVGFPIQILADTVSIMVDTGKRILGERNPK